MGSLNFPVQASPVWGDQSGRSEDVLSLNTGKAFLIVTKFKHSTRGEMMLGFWPLTSFDQYPDFALYTLDDRMRVRHGLHTIGITEAADDVSNDYASATEYPIAVGWFGEGYGAFMKRNGFWRLEWTGYQDEGEAYGGFSNYDSAGSLEDRFVIKERSEAIFAPDIEVTSPVIGTGSISGSETPHPAYEYVIEFDLDNLPSSGRIGLTMQHGAEAGVAHEYFYYRIDSNGLISVGQSVGGVETDLLARDTIEEGVKVRIVHDAYNLIIYADEEVVSYFCNPAYSDGFADDAPFTDWEVGDLGVGGAISNLKIFKRNLRAPTGSPGSDVVVNGAFAADTDWTKGTGWTITGGKAVKAAGAASYLEAAVDPLTEHKLYKVSVTLSDYVAGTVNVLLGDPEYKYRGTLVGNANGTFVGYQTCLGAAGLQAYADADFDGKIDDLVVQEVLFANSELGNILDSLLG